MHAYIHTRMHAYITVSTHAQLHIHVHVCVYIYVITIKKQHFLKKTFTRPHKKWFHAILGLICNAISDPKCNFRPLKWPPFPEIEVVWIKFTDKVPLTPSIVPAKFHCNTQNRVGEMCTNVISDPENGRNFLRSMSFEVKCAELNLTDKVPLTPTNDKSK